MNREQTTIRLPAELKEQLQQEADRMQNNIIPQHQLIKVKEIYTTLNLMEVNKKIGNGNWILLNACLKPKNIEFILGRTCP